MTSQSDLGIVEELPLLEAHQDLGIHALEVLVLAGMLEAQLLGLIQDVFPEVILLTVVPTAAILATVAGTPFLSVILA